jgi:hypothetical protein
VVVRDQHRKSGACEALVSVVDGGVMLVWIVIMVSFLFVPFKRPVLLSLLL